MKLTRSSHAIHLAPGLLLALMVVGPACTGEPGGVETTAVSATMGGSDPSGASMSSTSHGASTGTMSGGGDSTAATTSAGSGGGSDPSESDSGGCGFLCVDVGCPRILGPGGAPRCLPTCDVWAQDCPDGEKCSAWANDGGPLWNASRCTPVGEDELGEPCTVEGSGFTGVDSCALGAMCFHVDEEAGVGTCVGLCGGTPEAPSCAEPGTDCAISEDGILNLCLKTCDPLAQGCPDDQRCLDVGQGFFCVGAAEAPGGYGDPCEGSVACDAGLACIDDAAVPGCAGLRCCSPYCAVSAPNTCPGMPEQSCVPWYEPGQAPAGSEDLGVCAAL